MYNFRCMDNENKGANMYNGNVGMMYSGNMMAGMECPVIYECPIERVCHKEIHHHVPQDCHFMIDNNCGFISTN